MFYYKKSSLTLKAPFFFSWIYLLSVFIFLTVFSSLVSALTSSIFSSSHLSHAPSNMISSISSSSTFSSLLQPTFSLITSPSQPIPFAFYLPKLTTKTTLTTSRTNVSKTMKLFANKKMKNKKGKQNSFSSFPSPFLKLSAQVPSTLTFYAILPLALSSSELSSIRRYATAKNKNTLSDTKTLSTFTRAIFTNYQKNMKKVVFLPNNFKYSLAAQRFSDNLIFMDKKPSFCKLKRFPLLRYFSQIFFRNYSKPTIKFSERKQIIQKNSLEMLLIPVHDKNSVGSTTKYTTQTILEDEMNDQLKVRPGFFDNFSKNAAPQNHNVSEHLHKQIFAQSINRSISCSKIQKKSMIKKADEKETKFLRIVRNFIYKRNLLRYASKNAKNKFFPHSMKQIALNMKKFIIQLIFKLEEQKRKIFPIQKTQLHKHFTLNKVINPHKATYECSPGLCLIFNNLKTCFLLDKLNINKFIPSFSTNKKSVVNSSSARKIKLARMKRSALSTQLKSRLQKEILQPVTLPHYTSLSQFSSFSSSSFSSSTFTFKSSSSFITTKWKIHSTFSIKFKVSIILINLK